MDHLPRNFQTSTVDKMARVTLNGGAVKPKDPEDEKLIAEFLAKKAVTKCPPAGVTGNEAVRATNEHIARERRKFRKEQRAAAK